MQRNPPYPALVMDQVMVELGKHHGGDLTPINFCQAGSAFNPFAHMDIEFPRDALGHYRAYAPVNGQMSLRQAISKYYGEKFGYDLAPERICITVGATEALTIAFAMLTTPGAEVLFAASHFPPFRCLAHLFGVRCRYAPLNERNCIDIHQLADLITPQTAAIVINSPSNPHGAVLSAAELAAIGSLGVPVIFDEVYQALGLTAAPIPSAIHHSAEHLIVNSFSKSLSLAGFRVGYLIVPESAIGLMIDVKATTAFSTNAIGQAVAESALSHWDTLVTAHQTLLREQWQYFMACAQAVDVPLLAPPQAGLYGLVDLRHNGKCSAGAALDLAQTWAIGVAPGSDFQTPDPAYLRLNYAAPIEQIAPGLARIANYLGVNRK